MLIMGRYNGQTHNDSKPAGFNPTRRFMMYQQADKKYKVQFGAWACGSFSLEKLYLEHLQFRNRWSATNCGFDLTKYKGTMLYFEQHMLYDYLVFIDPEYETTEAFLKEATFHPIALITHPQTIVVKSKNRAGPRRARKYWVQRPSWWDSGWEFATNIAEKGMFIYFIMFIDLSYPWVDPYIDELKQSARAEEWWNDPNQKWKTDFDTHVRDSVNTQDLDTKQHEQENLGPLILKVQDQHSSQFIEQVTVFYKSHWYWGGRNLSIKKICDPKQPIHN